MGKEAGCGCADDGGPSVRQASRIGQVSSAIEPSGWDATATGVGSIASTPATPGMGFGKVSSAIEAAALQSQPVAANAALNVGNPVNIVDVPGGVQDLLGVDEIGSCGSSVGGFSSTDSVIESFMRSRKIPHIALGVMSGDGRLVYAKGFTNITVQMEQARETGLQACPRTQFRIASVSKLLTAVGIMKLVEDRELSLSTTLADLGLDDLYISDLAAVIASTSSYTIPATKDRWAAVTVQSLLTHTSGICERTSSPSPVYLGSGPMNMMSCSAHAWYKSDQTVQAYFGKQLPATRDYALYCLASSAMNPRNQWWSYANDGFILLGRIIEAVTGRDYESWIRENVLCPVGAYSTVLGEGDRFTRMEAPYYSQVWPWEMVQNRQATDSPNSLSTVQGDFGASAFDPYSVYSVYSPRGTRNIRLSEGGGGWISTVYDLLRFTRNLFAVPDSGSEARVIASSTVRQMCQSFVNLPNYSQGLGFKVAWYGSVADRGHTGHYDGTHARLYHVGALNNSGGTSTTGAYAYAILINRYWQTFDSSTPTESTLHTNLRASIGATVAAGTSGDLWDSV